LANGRASPSACSKASTRSPKLAPEVREAIYQRDGRRCVYCGRTPPEVKLTVDHVHPRQLGGRDDPSNLVTACRSCNSDKRDMTLRVYTLHLESYGRLDGGMLARVDAALAAFIDLDAARATLAGRSR
jgi:5-methylcytosine-specific restriction endonuclease McrA